MNDETEIPRPLAYGAWVLSICIGLVIGAIGVAIIDAAASYALGV